jgi:hypothetical protein
LPGIEPRAGQPAIPTTLFRLYRDDPLPHLI